MHHAATASSRLLRLLAVLCISALQPFSLSALSSSSGVTANLPAFAPQILERTTFPHSWLSGNHTDFAAWRSAAREHVRARWLTPPPTAESWDMRILDEEDRGAYVVRKISLNLTADSRVLAYMAVPKGRGPFPAVLLLHSHGAQFLLGKEKEIRPVGVSPELQKNASGHYARYYGGKPIGDTLAERGYVCFVTDAINFSDRGGIGYKGQAQLASNLMHLGMSFAGLIAWEDTRAAEFLAQQPEVDSSRLAALGLSLGAFRAWQVAAMSDRVKAGAAICWMADIRTLMTPENNHTQSHSAFSMLHPGLFTELDYPDIASLACPKPMLFFNGSADDLFPVSGVEAAYAKMRAVWRSQNADAKLVTRLWPGKAHVFDPEMQRAAFDWLDNTMRSGIPGDAAQPDIAAQPAGNPWAALPGILAQIKEPVFPARDFDITEPRFGAKPGGAHDCTGAIAKAISACHEAGGGRVVVPRGVFLTGAIHLKSNVNLHVSEGATLRFTTNPDAYLPAVLSRWEGIECMNYSPLIHAHGQENIAVTGKGVLDGGATLENWWGWVLTDDPAAKPARSRASVRLLNEMGDKNVPVAARVFGKGHYLRPPFVQFYRCTGILIEDVTIHRSPFWEINPVLCENITVRGVQIDTHGPNNDGCNPDSCRNVLIENCTFNAGDDCIAIKSGRNADGRRVNVPSENIIVRNCVMRDGHGGVVIGSEISAGCRNVFVENCEMNSPSLDRALRFKSNAVRGGIMENIHMRNIAIGQVAEAILTIDLLYQDGDKGAHPPTIRNISLENVTGKSTPRILQIAGFKNATIDDIRFKNCAFEGVTSTEFLSHAGSVLLDNVAIIPVGGPRPISGVRPVTE